ncbi:MAG: hypothetical protein GY818_06955 [Planctomycetaceae bacterium]|nr:hypothetical protein [Planctomycetaceae bacterium]
MNSNNKPSGIPLVEHLSDRWLDAKKAEKAAADARKAIELEIRKTTEFTQSVTEKTFGARSFSSISMNIPERRKWDHKGLTGAFLSMPNEYFPFRIEFKEDRKAVQLLAENRPELYAEIKDFLTIETGNPSFSAPKKAAK